MTAVSAEQASATAAAKVAASAARAENTRPRGKRSRRLQFDDEKEGDYEVLWQVACEGPDPESEPEELLDEGVFRDWDQLSWKFDEAWNWGV